MFVLSLNILCLQTVHMTTGLWIKKMYIMETKYQQWMNECHSKSDFYSFTHNTGLHKASSRRNRNQLVCAGQEKLNDI